MNSNVKFDAALRIHHLHQNDVNHTKTIHELLEGFCCSGPHGKAISKRSLPLFSLFLMIRASPPRRQAEEIVLIIDIDVDLGVPVTEKFSENCPFRENQLSADPT